MTATCLTLLSALMLSQAGGEKKEAPKAGMSAAAAHATVIFVNASPDSADITVDGTKWPALASGKDSGHKEIATTAKIEAKAGTQAVPITGMFAADKHYTIVLHGKTGTVKAETIEAKYAAGKAHVAAVNGSENATVDINSDGKALITGLGMGKSQEKDVDAGKHKIEVMAGSAAAAATKDLDAKADESYAIVVVSAAGKTDLIIVSHPAAKKMGAMPEKK